jgi:hypothetical protein
MPRSPFSGLRPETKDREGSIIIAKALTHDQAGGSQPSSGRETKKKKERSFGNVVCLITAQQLGTISTTSATIRLVFAASGAENFTGEDQSMQQ